MVWDDDDEVSAPVNDERSPGQVASLEYLPDEESGAGEGAIPAVPTPGERSSFLRRVAWLVNLVPVDGYHVCLSVFGLLMVWALASYMQLAAYCAYGGMAALVAMVIAGAWDRTWQWAESYEARQCR
jgi:hypothetical protein